MQRIIRQANYIYLLHFTTPVGHARHYLGSAACVETRLKEHRAGQGARLTQVAVIRGAELLLVRTWKGGRNKERAIKDSYHHAFTALCPICNPGAGSNPKRATVTKYL